MTLVAPDVTGSIRARKGLPLLSSEEAPDHIAMTAHRGHHASPRPDQRSSWPLGSHGAIIDQGRRRYRRAAPRPWPRESLLARSPSSVLSTATTCDTLATASCGRPVVRAVSGRFPGASAHRKLLVSGTHTTVASRLRFKASPCTTTTGLRQPGPDPGAAGRSAHQTCPGHYHSVCSRTRRPAVATNASGWSPTSSHTSFIASVTSSAVWRATYSLRAALKTALRDRRARPGQSFDLLENLVWNRDGRCCRTPASA